MGYRSNLARSVETAEYAPQTKRRHHRQKIHTLAYVKLDSANGGTLRDISEAGFAIQALAPLSADQQIHLRLDLPNPRFQFEAEARVVWADSHGQAGLEFLNLPARSRRLLKEWLFTQLLADAHRAAGEEAPGLLFSSTPRLTIRLHDAHPLQRHPQTDGLDRVSVLWFTISASGFSRLVDGLVLLCAVLLFSIITLILTDVLPSWPFAVAFVAGAAAMFGALYWLLFSLWLKATPGERLAMLAHSGSGSRAGSGEEDRARFR
jgi:PilZ domain-containing protein